MHWNLLLLFRIDNMSIVNDNNFGIWRDLAGITSRLGEIIFLTWTAPKEMENNAKKITEKIIEKMDTKFDELSTRIETIDRKAEQQKH